MNKRISRKTQCLLAVIPYLGFFLVFFMGAYQISKRKNRLYAVLFYLLSLIPIAVFLVIAVLALRFLDPAPGERRPCRGTFADRHVCHHAVPCICGARDRILYDQTIDKRGGTAVKIIEGEQADCLRSRFIDAFIR